MIRRPRESFRASSRSSSGWKCPRRQSTTRGGGEGGGPYPLWSPRASRICPGFSHQGVGVMPQRLDRCYGPLLRRPASDPGRSVPAGRGCESSLVTSWRSSITCRRSHVPRAPSDRGPTAQSPRAAFFAFLAWRFSFRLADASFLLFFPPLSFDGICGLLTDCGQPGRAAPIAYRHFADDERRIAVGVTRVRSKACSPPGWQTAQPSATVRPQDRIRLI